MSRVAVFARWPTAGRVKTRLAPALTEALAGTIYRAMLEDALAAALASGAGERLLYWGDPPVSSPTSSPFASAADIRGEEHFTRRMQQGADLGARLVAAFAELLVAPDDRAIVIGADCPALGAREIDAAFIALEAHEMVIGPARDGGYYLIGLSRAAPEIFAGIPWGTAAVFEETMRRARAAELRAFVLDPLDDLDTAEDLVRWIRSAALGEPRPAPAMAAALRAMGLLPPRIAEARSAR
jgi:hypothetical protein